MIEVHDKTLCKGDAVTLDGGIYRKLDEKCTVTSIKANGQAEELKDKKILSPAQTTQYTIWYNGGGATQTVSFTITVMEKPSLNVAVIGGKTTYCPDDEVTLRATVIPTGQEVFWVVTADRYSSDAMASGKGLETKQSLSNGSCWITFQAYNTCGVVEVPSYFKVMSQSDLSKAELILDTVLDGTFCFGCGFFPNVTDIVKGVRQDGAEISATVTDPTVKWADGKGTEEIIISDATFSAKVNVTANVTLQDAVCGATTAVSKQLSAENVTLKISGGLDCKPTMQTAVSVKPCRDGEVQLRNPRKDLCIVQP
ncbi:MAG: hypothetical protein K2I87_03750, partial [Bacteroidales bacterium]|nr:hypothetical protein [Bacteroidales bacterium]